MLPNFKFVAKMAVVIEERFYSLIPPRIMLSVRALIEPLVPALDRLRRVGASTIFPGLKK
jgi:hypothetical protein